MPTQLKHLRITRVDSVDRGANVGAKVAFWKRDDDADDDSIEEKETPTASQTLDAAAAAYAKVAGVTLPVAFDAVFRTPEGSALYAEATAEQVSERYIAARDARRSALGEIVFGVESNPYSVA